MCSDLSDVLCLGQRCAYLCVVIGSHIVVERLKKKNDHLPNR